MQFLINSKLIYLVISMKGFNSVNPAHKTSWPTFPLKLTTTPTPHWHTHTQSHTSQWLPPQQKIPWLQLHSPCGQFKIYFIVVHLLKFGNKFCFLIFPNEVLQLFPSLKLLPSPPQLGSASIQDLKGSLLRGKVHHTCKFSGNERDKGTM